MLCSGQVLPDCYNGEEQNLVSILHPKKSSEKNVNYGHISNQQKFDLDI